MSILPEPVQNLIEAFERLPGIGPKTASRLTFYILRGGEELPNHLAAALQAVHKETRLCSRCFSITLAGQELCEICSDDRRDRSILCVVEEPLDVLMLERTGVFNGQYHVLHGVLSPIDGIGPDDLHIRPLLQRTREGQVKELIIATNPSMEGDATALYIKQQLAGAGIRITRLARGLPVGSDLEYADQTTLLRALTGRQDLT
jgi:recombination protein RecR